MDDGAQRIAAERATHDVRGYGADYIAQHVNGELLAAAMCYMACADPVNLDPTGDFIFGMWPWSLDLFHPDADPIRNLEFAGAMVAAEIDRQRAAANSAAPARF